MVATRDFIVTDVPQDLTANAALALASGERWSIQNVDPRSRVFIRVQVDAPAVGSLGNFIAPGEHGYPTADAGEGIWVWSPDDDAVPIVVNSAG